MKGLTRAAVIAVGAGLLLALASTDLIAGAVMAAGTAMLVWIVRRPGRSILRKAFAGILAVFTLCLSVAALGTYDFRTTRSAEVVTPSAHFKDAVSPPARGRRMEVMGFLASDYSDSDAGLDRSAAALSIVAATKLTLSGTTPGQVDALPVGDTIPVRAHVNAATAELLLSNFIGQDFNGPLARQVLNSDTLRHTLVANIVARMTANSPAWDGIVLDLENLPAGVRSSYPKLISDLRAAFATPAVRAAYKKRAPTITVAVPATTPDSTDLLVGYDLRALGRLADRVVWLAYDQHTLAGGAGPIGGIAWVRSTLQVVLSQVPANKVLLGIAGYGYRWNRKGPGTELTASDVAKLLAQSGTKASYDKGTAEERLTFADGSQAWFSNARSFGDRARVAADHHLAGVALWRLGSATPQTFAMLPGPPIKHPGLPLGNRPVQLQTGNGLVALTFDDGPDPHWTPQVLRILHDQHVSGTFFDIGKEVLDHPELVQQEVQSGNVVGSHTYTHANLDQVSRLRAQIELRAGQGALEGAIGRTPLLFRPPYGSGDRVGAAGTTVDTLAADLGLVQIDWTDDPEDWKPGAKAANIVTSVLAGASANSIVLMHDGGGNRQATIDALPRIIEGLRARGFTFVTADQLTSGLSSPYSGRHGLASQITGALVIAAFRTMRMVQITARDVVLVLGIISILRLLVVTPLAYAHLRRSRRRTARREGQQYEDEATLDVTVVIPAYNEEAVIAQSIESLLRLTGPSAPGHIIVVDDGSTDQTFARANQFGDRVQVLQKPNGGKASALNLGIAAATSEIVVVLDADTMLSGDFIPAIAPHFGDPAVVAVAGNVRVGNRRKLLAKLQAVEYVGSLNLDRRAQDVLNTIAVIPGAAGAFRRTAVLDAGGYPHDTLVEDADLTVVLLRRGGRVHYEPAALVWTEVPERVKDALRQRRRWSFGTVQVCTKHSDILLSPAAGRVGMIAIPWTLLTQILLPITSPVTDFYLLWMLATGSPVNLVLVALALAAGIDLLVMATVIAIDGEQWRLMLYTPLLRWVWRPIQIYAVLSASRGWARGERQRWQPSVRYASVNPTMLLMRTPGVLRDRLHQRMKIMPSRKLDR